MSLAGIYDKIITLKKREADIKESINQCQEEHYGKKSISKKDYINKVKRYYGKMEDLKESIARSEAKLAGNESPDEIHKALDALIKIKDDPKPISLQRERIDAIKGKVMPQSQPAKTPYKKSEGKPEGKNEIIGRIKGRIKVEDIKNLQKIQKGYIKHYSGYFSKLKSAQFEIKPRVISKITAYKGNILRHFKEVYKNEHE